MSTADILIKHCIEMGLEKGIEKEKLETAKKMLNKGFDIELIVELTGLNKEKVENIKS